jgi:hypothetical protein
MASNHHQNARYIIVFFSAGALRASPTPRLRSRSVSNPLKIYGFRWVMQEGAMAFNA